MTEVASDLIVSPGGAMELPPELAAELDALAQTGEELGGTLLDMLAIYTADRDRWKTGEEKKDNILGIYLHSLSATRTFWPPGPVTKGVAPTCFSFDGEKPAPEVEDPQSAECEGCPWNEFETAHQGRGKACKTKRADFIVEIDEEKLETDDEGRKVVTADAVLGIALIRCSATAKETRMSVGQWAKDIRSTSRGIPQLVLTRWSLKGTTSTGGTDFYAPTLVSEGAYQIDRDSLEEVVQTSKDLRNGQAIEILTTLAGGSEESSEDTND
jgi:hypothetical protein